MNRILHYRKILLIGLALCAGISFLRAQLSPGQLAQDHAHLEGLSNCTKCHVLGESVSNAKCLDCHTALHNRIIAGEGFHVSAGVRQKNCFECHSDHHGRNFDMIRFDTEHFDHDLTGYALTGAHETLNCAQCHTPEFIADPSLRKPEGTYLGLSTDCISCHEDYHQNTLTISCHDCHDTKAFRPAPLFSHDDTAYPLTGQHTSVDCQECHPVTTRQGKEFQQFGGVAFNQCSSCHTDPHSGRLGPDCKTCHSETSFETVPARVNFNHNTTGFPLLGRHNRIACNACHNMDVRTENVFRDFTESDSRQCASCHTDPHDNRFGADCRSCHTEESFHTIAGGLDQFNHSMTSFPLEGKHEVVDCRACHTASLTDPLPFQQCTDCHTDYHEGQFAKNSQEAPDCAACHTVEGFAGSTFSIAQHNAGAFPLDGAHVATPCTECHLREDHWTFHDIGTACLSCHEDIHADDPAERFDPENTCTTCHVTERWSDVNFDHTLTDFALSGTHSLQSCVACHAPDPDEAGMAGRSFAGLSTACESCHSDIHYGQFKEAEKTDCSACHGFELWKPSLFDHDSARFVLDGAHREVSCSACHVPVEQEDAAYVLYRLGMIACHDCHE